MREAVGAAKGVGGLGRSSGGGERGGGLGGGLGRSRVFEATEKAIERSGNGDNTIEHTIQSYNTIVQYN